MYKFAVYYFANGWLPLKHYMGKRVPCLNEKFKKSAQTSCSLSETYMYRSCDEDLRHVKVQWFMHIFVCLNFRQIILIFLLFLFK